MQNKALFTSKYITKVFYLDVFLFKVVNVNNFEQIECHAAVTSTGVRPIPVAITMNQIKTISAQNEMKCAWWKCGLWFESLDLLANHVSQVHAISEPSGLFYCRWEGCTRNNRGFNAR